MIHDQSWCALQDFIDDAKVVSSQRASCFGDFHNGVDQHRRLDFRSAPGELNLRADTVSVEPTPSEIHCFGRNPLAFDIGNRLDLRILRHAKHPANRSTAYLGENQLAHLVHVCTGFHNPVMTGNACVQDAYVDVTRHLLRANEQALDVRVVYHRIERTTGKRNLVAGAFEQFRSRVAQTPRRQA